MHGNLMAAESINLTQLITMKTKMVFRRYAALAAMVMLCCSMILINTNAHAQSRPIIGYVDMYGNGVLTISATIVETAFTDELNSDSEATLFSTTFSTVNITEISGTYYLVAFGSNKAAGKITSKIALSENVNGNLLLGAETTCSCCCSSSTQDCDANCDANGLCPCTQETQDLTAGADDLGDGDIDDY